MNIGANELQALTESIFAAAGSNTGEAEVIARRLVGANLAGHDSHGVIQVPTYIKWIDAGKVMPNQSIQTIIDNDVLAVVDGQFGFGQVIGEQAMSLAIQKSRTFGIGVVGLRNSGHLGRIGDWAEMAAEAGCVSLHFVNTSGLGILVPPHGGYDARLSANPIAAGIPRNNAPDIILDISTGVIAEGKIRVALNKGEQVPEGCVLDANGRPTTDPRVFYGPPKGAILPFGGHKGYGLGVIAEVLAGAFSAAACSNPNNSERLANNMLSIILDPSRVQRSDSFHDELERFIEYVKTSRTIAPNGDILLPGEIEARNRAERLARGVDLDPTTWESLEQVARDVGVHMSRTP
jgi:hydroxycarboxylate dehydrogenase B